MIQLKNIQPLSDFLRNAKARLGRLKKTGEPAILTVNGQAEAVVFSAHAYEKLIEELETEKTQHIAGSAALEMFRSGQITGEELLASLKPNPRAQTIAMDEAFAQIDRRIQHRRKKKAS